MLTACDKGDTATATAPAGPVTVGFWAGEQQSRTAIGDDGRSVLWRNSDRVALWAKDSSGNYVLENKDFDISFLNVPATKACFATELAAAMPEGTYTYYAACPVPKSVNGTQASFTLPATQDGRLSDGADIMIAEPCEAPQLEELKIRDDNSGYEVEARNLSLTMRHLAHALKFYIPEGYNTLGEPVERIRLKMPHNIAGTVTADIADPARQPSLAADATSSISIALAEPLDASAEESRQYAYASILPPAQAYASGERMYVVLYSANYAARAQEIDIAGCAFEAGHITPVLLHPQEKTDSYKIRFTIAGNNLGEDVQKVMLTAPAALNDGVTVDTPAGCSWTAEGNSITVSAAEGATLKTGEYFEVNFDPFDEAGISLYRAMTGNFTAEYESEHAWHLTQTVAVNTSTGTKADAPLTVPYLFAEDFSGTSTGFNMNGNLSASGHSTNTIEGTDYGLAGWTGNQVAVIEAGGNKAMVIRHQNECSSIGNAQGTYRGRIDSAPINNIKPGTQVKIAITFNYTGYANSTAEPQITYGYTTTEGAISGKYLGGSSLIQGGDLIENIAGDKISAPKDGTVNSINRSASFKIENCDNTHRLSWDCYAPYNRNDASAFGKNTQQWIFIDNIKVQIAH